MIRSIPPVCSCDASETDHELRGYNLVGRPVWECLDCGETRAGPSSVDDARRELAADGGTDK